MTKGDWIFLGFSVWMIGIFIGTMIGTYYEKYHSDWHEVNIATDSAKINMIHHGEILQDYESMSDGELREFGVLLRMRGFSVREDSRSSLLSGQVFQDLLDYAAWLEYSGKCAESGGYDFGCTGRQNNRRVLYEMVKHGYAGLY